MKRALKKVEPQIGDLVLLSPKAPVLGWVQQRWTKHALNMNYYMYLIEWFPDEEQTIKYFGTRDRQPLSSFNATNTISMKEFLKDYLK